jgi:hypothetical protein
MPVLKATEPTLDRASVGIKLEYGKHTQTEIYFTFTVNLRGTPVNVDVMSDSYLAKSPSGEVWTRWRTRTQGYGKFTEAQYRAISEAVEPLAEAWREEYFETAKRDGFARALRRVLRDDNYSTDRSRKALATYGHEVEPEELARLNKAVEHLEAFLALTS